MTPRVVITGIGLVAPSGTTTAEHWHTVTSAQNRIGPISLFDASGYPTTLAGEVRGFDIEARVPGRLAVQTDRWTWMSFVAAEQALSDAGFDPATEDPYAFSVVMASSSGGNQFGQRELARLWGQPGRKVGAYQSIAWFYAATVGQLSIRHQAKGPSSVLVAEGAGGLDTLGYAARLIRRGVSVALCGGLEAPLSPYALACQLRSGRLSGADDPRRAYLPFDAAASGYVPGEGGAVLVLEELEHARARGAPIYAELAGWASTHDGVYAGRAVDASGHWYAEALRLATERAGVAPPDVDVLIPDALGVPEYDRAEAAAVRTVFGTGTPVTSSKALTGRMYQGGAALDVATALLAMRQQTLPASAGTAEPAPGCELDFVAANRPARVDTAVVGARGFDGYNTSVVLRRFADTDTDTDTGTDIGAGSDVDAGTDSDVGAGAGATGAERTAT
ncbi:ketosynthase chain-length factor [Plantactinospora sp. KBS50]|nr:beta-ketoacyl synthase N-terminal-like domain-containing protein [Plantactinospora sp. KBS50]ASW56782.1 ketosynthase chain-length factor [Plantactinospora sp. KBS50]